MSTSNIKSPIAIRQGYVNSWDKEGLTSEFEIQFLRWELNKQNITPIRYLRESNILLVFYYKWIQLPFRSKVSQKLSLSVKQEINNAEFLGNISLAVVKNSYKSIKSQKRVTLIDSLIRSQRNYQIPFITQAFLSQYLTAVNPVVLKEVRFINVFKQANFSHRVIDLRKFANETSLIKGSIKSIYHILDMSIIVDLFSLRICNGELMGTLIGKILERSSRKGLFIRSLRVLSKLPTLIKRFEIKKKMSSNRSWGWSIRITGKIGGMGRTKVYNLFSEKIPLHTINDSINYSETIVNTKAGSFSIKVWSLQ